MEKQFSQFSSALLLLLTAIGFMIPGVKKRFLGLMNVDTTHSIIRTPLTLALLYGASDKSTVKATRSILLGMGIFYIGVGTAGLTNRKLYGLLPSGLTSFDLGYHFTVGVSAIWLGCRSGRMMKP
jgi:hypothetical protein